MDETLFKYKKKALLITGLGTFMGTLDSSIVNVSLPTIGRELNCSISMVGWVVLAYAITVFSLLMVFGALSEKKGYQFSYTNGFTIFLIGSTLCGLSFNIYMLIASRILQGVGATFMVAVGPALVTHSHPSEERGRGLSVIAMVVSSGLMLGPPLGGFIVSYIGWRWIFFVNLPVSLAGIYFTRKYIGDFPITNPDKKIGIPSTITLFIGLMMLMGSLLFFSKQFISLFQMILILVATLGVFGLFLYFESKPETSLIGLEIFKNRVFMLSGASMLLVFIALISVSILLPFYLEDIKKLSPDEVGLYLMAVPLSMLIIARPAGYLADKFRASIISTIGGMIMLVGLVIFTGIHVETAMQTIVMGLILIGVGMALFSTPNTTAIMGSVRRYQLGSASGMIATIRTLGIALGAGISIAIFSFIQNSYKSQGAADTVAFMFGYETVYKIMIAIIVLGIIFSAIRGDNRNNSKSVVSEKD